MTDSYWNGCRVGQIDAILQKNPTALCNTDLGGGLIFLGAFCIQLSSLSELWGFHTFLKLMLCVQSYDWFSPSSILIVDLEIHIIFEVIKVLHLFGELGLWKPQLNGTPRRHKQLQLYLSLLSQIEKSVQPPAVRPLTVFCFAWYVIATGSLPRSDKNRRSTLIKPQWYFTPLLHSTLCLWLCRPSTPPLTLLYQYQIFCLWYQHITSVHGEVGCSKQRPLMETKCEYLILAVANSMARADCEAFVMRMCAMYLCVQFVFILYCLSLLSCRSVTVRTARGLQMNMTLG